MNDLTACWSTVQVQGIDALHTWSERLSETLHGMNVSAPPDTQFRASLRSVNFGPAIMSFADGSPQRAERNQHQIIPDEEQYFTVLYTHNPPYEIHQYGRSILVPGGQCAIYDTKEPYVVNFPTAIDCFGLQIKQDWLRRWLPFPEDITARPLGAEGWSAALLAVLRALAQQDLDRLLLPPGVIMDQVGALLSLAVECDTELSPPRQKLVRRLRQTLKERCHEADFDPAALADAHRISKRYVHKVLTSAGTSFGRELILARLEQARQLLNAAQFKTLTMNEIAWRCGFTAPGHFSRRFRQHFGVSPSSYRQTVHS